MLTHSTVPTPEAGSLFASFPSSSDGTWAGPWEQGGQGVQEANADQSFAELQGETAPGGGDGGGKPAVPQGPGTLQRDPERGR